MQWSDQNKGSQRTGDMAMRREAYPIKSDPTKRAIVAQFAKKANSDYDCDYDKRWQNIQCITACCIWGCVDTDQSLCPCWPQSTAESAYNGQVRIRTGQWSNGRRWYGLKNHIFFNIIWTDGYMGNRWQRDALWEEDKPARHCGALGNVLQRDLENW